MKGFRVSKIIKEINFGGIWDKLEAKKCSQRQGSTKYLGLSLVIMWNSALMESLISVFQEGFASIVQFFILTGRLGTRL